MIYLIGGPPRAGKTTLSRMLSKRLGIPCISVDTLESIVRMHTPRSEWALKFPKNEMRKKAKNNNDLMYDANTAKKIMQAYATQAKATWRAIEIFIECEVGEGNDYIIEGHQIHPALVFRLRKKYSQNLHAIFLVNTDPAQLVKNARKSKAPRDWFLKKTKEEKTYIKIATMLCLYGEYIKKEASKKHLTVISTDAFRKGVTEAMVVAQSRSKKSSRHTV